MKILNRVLNLDPGLCNLDILRLWNLESLGTMCNLDITFNSGYRILTLRV